MTPDSIAKTLEHPLPAETTEPMELQRPNVAWHGEVQAHLEDTSVVMRGLELGRTHLLAAGRPRFAVGDAVTLELELRGYRLWISAHVDRLALAGDGVGLYSFRLGVTSPRGTDLLAELAEASVPPRRADCVSFEDEQTAVFRKGSTRVVRLGPALLPPPRTAAA